MDDVGGTIKNAVLRKVKSGQIVVHTPKDFSDAAMKFVPSIISVYLPKLDEIVEPESIHQAPSIPETHSIHKFVRQINGRGDCNIEFFKTVVDQEAFYTQRCRKASDAVCGHEKSNKSDSECSTCGEWYTEDGNEWLQMSYLRTVVSRNVFLRLNLILNLVSDGNNIFFILLI